MANAPHTKNIGEGEETLLSFPALFPIKAMGRMKNDASDESFAQVVLAVDSLPASFHGDPADRLIVATARAHRLPLATRDAAIRRSRAVTLWKR